MQQLDRRDELRAMLERWRSTWRQWRTATIDGDEVKMLDWIQKLDVWVQRTPPSRGATGA